jgi:hypothetical protein
MNDDKMVCLRTFSNLLDAEIALEHLESHGIDAMISKDDSGGMAPYRQQTLGVDIFVLETDIEKAERVLNAMNV